MKYDLVHLFYYILNQDETIEFAQSTTSKGNNNAICRVGKWVG